MTIQIPQNPERTLNSIEAFLNEFRCLFMQETGNTLDQFHLEFDRIRDNLKALKQQTLEEGLNAAPEFNVFRLLGLSRSEVRTHSAMLAHLFRPGEIHGQKFLFLKSFLDYCHRKDPSFRFPSDEIETAHWDVITELITASDGRMDIVIRNPDLGYIVVIENKVDAWEQTDQLMRYGRWLETQRRDYPDQGLIYLTLLGSQAYTAQSVPYLALSYHYDISKWLSNILDCIKAFNVREVISQYTSLVQKL